MFMEIITNKIVLGILITLILTQLTKFFIAYFQNRKFDLIKLVDTGGMPSSHSSLVTALTVSVFLKEGFGTLFLVALIFSAIVIRDAMGIRRHAGEQAVILNKIIQTLKLRRRLGPKLGPVTLKEILGHTPMQVVVGIIYGAVITVIVRFIF